MSSSQTPRRGCSAPSPTTSRPSSPHRLVFCSKLLHCSSSSLFGFALEILLIVILGIRTRY
uniref:Uncharacterized protein n=1 Tax=Setaria italica TaxID=4555 RepID=K4A436_SETIT